MVKISPEIQSLIVKSLEEEITSSEKAKLDEWLARDNNMSLFEDLKAVWDESGHLSYDTLDGIDIETALLKTKRKIVSDRELVITRSKPRRSLLMAACFALLALGLGYFTLNNTIGNSGFETIVAENNLEVNLPDNSKVWLNEGSQITYPKDFEDNRDVVLIGTAVFDVTHNPTAPFTIDARDMKVTVLGTKFIVGNNLDEADYVNVIEGKVKVTDFSNSESDFILTQDMSLKRNKDSKLSHSDKIENSMFWATGILSYKETPLTTIFKELESHYSVVIKQQSDLSACMFTGKFSTKKLSEIIENLQLIFDLEVDQTNSTTLIIAGESC